MKVPFVDLRTQYLQHRSELDDALSNVISDAAFVGGGSNKYVKQFERSFAEYLGLEHVITCANGTDSLEILLEAFEITKDDEVIVPAISWISTSEAVGRIGAKPIFVDVCYDTLLIDTEKIEAAITSRTKAIIPVHLYGNAVDMERIMAIAKRNKLIVIEDCAQSHGSKFNNMLTGTFGHASSFSFYPGKNLGAYGDAGAMATNDPNISKKCAMIANHGQIKKHEHLIEGRNSRMDGIHSAILSVKLKYLDNWNELRRRNAEYYINGLAGSTYILPKVNNNATHVYHLFVIRSDKRDELKEFLQNNQIECAIHYPTALPFMEAYKKFKLKPEDYKVAYQESKRILSIPMYPELSEAQMNYVISKLLEFEQLTKQ